MMLFAVIDKLLILNTSNFQILTRDTRTHVHWFPYISVSFSYMVYTICYFTEYSLLLFFLSYLSQEERKGSSSNGLSRRTGYRTGSGQGGFTCPLFCTHRTNFVDFLRNALKMVTHTHLLSLYFSCANSVDGHNSPCKFGLSFPNLIA